MQNLIHDYPRDPIALFPDRESYLARKHPFMDRNLHMIRETLQEPDEVRVSVQDQGVHLYYRWYTDTALGDKYICVVVKWTDTRKFVITAYPTDRIKAADLVWQKTT